MTSIQKRYEKDQTRLIDLLRCVQDAKETGFEQTRNLFAEFRAQLEGMISSEEGNLFPRFDESNGLTGEGATAVMRVEHRQIRWLLDEIGKKLLRGDMGTDAEQIVLMEFLRAHLQQERAVVYSTLNEAPNTNDGEKPSVTNP